jgi:hypothetical protein
VIKAKIERFARKFARKCARIFADCVDPNDGIQIKEIRKLWALLLKKKPRRAS